MSDDGTGDYGELPEQPEETTWDLYGIGGDLIGGPLFTGSFDDQFSAFNYPPMNADPFTGLSIADPLTTLADADTGITGFAEGFTVDTDGWSADSPSRGFDGSTYAPVANGTDANPFKPADPPDLSQAWASNSKVDPYNSWVDKAAGLPTFPTPVYSDGSLPPLPSTTQTPTGAPSVTAPTVTPPATGSTPASPVASDYDPAADRVDQTAVYVPPESSRSFYWSFYTWQTADISPPQTISSPSDPLPVQSVQAPPPRPPQTPEAHLDFWTQWFGDLTQTEWAIPAPAPDPRLIQPITHYDSGNQSLNFVLNKGVLPWRNLLGTIDNFGVGVLLGLSDLDQRLKEDPKWGLDYQALPLELAAGGRLLGLTEQGFSGISWASEALGPELEGELPALTNPELQAGEPALSVSSPAISPRLVERLAAWKRYEPQGQFGLPDWVRRTQGAPWGTGFPTGYGRLGSLSRTLSQVQINNQFGRAVQQSVQVAVGQPENFTLLEGSSSGIWTS